jgi:hypothetical protein
MTIISYLSVYIRTITKHNKADENTLSTLHGNLVNMIDCFQILRKFINLWHIPFI